MPKAHLTAVTIFLAGSLLPGITLAQQTSTPPTPPPATASKPGAAPKAQTAPAAKSGTTAAKTAPAPLVLKTPKDKASYAIGMNIGKSLHKDAVDVDGAIIARGLKDALAGDKALLTDEEAQAALTTLQNEVRTRQQESRQQALEKNKTDGETFLAANKDKPGVVVLPSGLQYKIITPGTGPKPLPTDTVVCNYRGTLLDGTEFDSSYKRGQPATFPVSGVIKGWTEALQLMGVGSKWQLFIPSALAYGEAGTPRGGPIGPNETLVFDVELMSIQPKAEAPAAAPASQPQTPPAPASQPQASATTPAAQPPAPAAPAPQPQTPPQAKP